MTTELLQTTELNDLIHSTKGQNYTQITKKLMEPTTRTKEYWSMLIICLNDKNIPCIPTLFHDISF